MAWIGFVPVGAAAPDDLASLKGQYHRPASIPFPADNPYTADKAALGKALYFDPRLSGSGNISCMHCHNPSFGWSDGQDRARGALAQRLDRHSPTVLNLAWANRLFWDGRAGSLEEQARGPITAPAEMDMPLDKLVERLRAIEGYQRWFDRVFPGTGVTDTAITQAIATFERTMVSGHAPFDAWIEGDEAAIPETAKRGFKLFNGKAGCAACHSGWAFTDYAFHDVGLPDDDTGRARVATGDPAAEHAFKTPSLRNIRQRAPYMHDGSLPTLEAVMGHYVRGGEERPSRSRHMRPLDLGAQDVSDLIAFLDTLTGDDAPMPLPILPH